MQGTIREMLSGILPTYQLERNWPSDQLDLWAINGITDQTIPAGVPLHASGSLHNISDQFDRELQKELLVWRVTGELYNAVNEQVIEEPLHLFSPVIGYNPEAIPATGPLPNTGVFLPWLQPQRPPPQIAVFPTAGHLDMGYNVSAQVVVVGADTHIGIGPTQGIGNDAGTAGVTRRTFDFSLGGVDAPPFRIQPGRKLTVQTVRLQPAGFTRRIDVSFWYSERDFAIGP